MKNINVDSNSMVLVFKLSFIAMLVSVFIIKFAMPSFNKFREAGVIVERHSIRREHRDTPTITFCAVNAKYMGWKNDSIRLADIFYPWRRICNNASTVEAAMACINKKTFNLTETINSHHDQIGMTRDMALDMSKEVWTNYVTTYSLGELFRLANIDSV